MKLPRNKALLFDFFLLALLLIGAAAETKIGWTKYLDELVILYFLAVIFFKIKKLLCQNKLLNIVVGLYLFYSFVLCLFYELPGTSYLQIVITSKFIIFYYYFSLKSANNKEVFFRYLLPFLSLIFWISVGISVAQFIKPGLLEAANKDGRGINGVALQGIYLSRTLFSSFLVLLILILATLKGEIKNEVPIIFKYRKIFIFFSLLLLFLTFTRKDLVFAMGFLVYLLCTSKTRYRGLLRGIAFALIIISPFLSQKFFNKINEQTFTEDYVRLIILDSGLKVFDHYFPFGSGPGTFGSIMSIEYEEVYKELNIPERIYQGYGDQLRGPIFDVFIVALLAEYGLGLIFFGLILYQIYRSPSNELLEDYFQNKNFKKYGIIYIVLTSLTVPVLNTFQGFLYFIIFAVTSKPPKK